MQETKDDWHLYYKGLAIIGSQGVEAQFYDGVTKDTSFVESIIILTNNWLEFWKIKNNE